MQRPPPTSTLFPYTTLFRSLSGRESTATMLRARELAVDEVIQDPTARKLPAFEALLKRRDRKSTRLNSSHGYISYAVFCLKKKKFLKHYSGTVLFRVASR